MRRTTKELYMQLNINPDQYYGNCRSKSGNNACSNGTYCIKRASINSIGFSGLNYHVTTFTKGCSNVREDNGQPIVPGCYDLNRDTSSFGMTTKRVDCYCDTDFCNSSSTSSFMLVLAILLFMFYFCI